MLLPLPREAARARSLKFHAALATVRLGFGCAEHLAALARAMYVSWFLQRAGYGELPLAQFHVAGHCMETANRRGVETDAWYFDEDGYPFFERILTLHDRQLDAAPAHALIEADDELMRFVRGTKPSPLPPRPPREGTDRRSVGGDR
ncbi:MAG: hypothetical protein PCALPYG88_5694 [uncultured Paraburkholderia sp.]|uniref:hypothetical protein n=1 Tax=uncultured Paraburkholderia sp. TaxID=1822466 RepID=UPI00259944F8|nr:hypothetical protein [uncultured Paraburkholderia sp.]CAH2902158.1 MAG: hypothetical protein PCALPYG08_5850 [uncultured Paraburkholderia sp.]CAH2936437.1 MAG: hypothetical protein PCALPYG88_5694 [uncultured Paraburkholderia sp.]